MFDHQKLCQGHQQGRKVSSRIVAHSKVLMLMYGFACITLTINAVESLWCQISAFIAKGSMGIGHNEA